MAIRFLVVDDASFIRDMVKKQLRDRIPGCEVYDAADGHRAVAQLKKQRVDVILSDWEMPEMSGEQLLRWVREQEPLKKTPFIMITSRGDREHVVQAVQAGVSDYITKPFTSDDLLKKTVKQLKKLGKSPGDSVKMASSGQGVAFASIDVLTGGKSTAGAAPPAAGRKKPASAQGHGATTAGSGNRPAVARKSPAGGKVVAQLRFANLACSCVVRDVTLQSLSGLIQRSDPLPGLFEQTVVDIEVGDGEIARVNGYLSSIAAGENRQDSQVIKIGVQFVDNDPQKFATLSKFIASAK